MCCPCFGEGWNIQTKLWFLREVQPVFVKAELLWFLEREVSWRGFSTVLEQPAARKLKKREHRYL